MSSTEVKGRRFWKMSGSGNDFVFFDARTLAPGMLETKPLIDRICARATGIGADGVVFIQHDASEAFSIRYFNRDGSLAELCGNASLCSTRLGVALGLGQPEGLRFATDAGVISARLRGDDAEIDLQPVTDVRVNAAISLTGAEERIGFAVVGVPHLVVLAPGLDSVDVLVRGRELRNHPDLPGGANVNFVAKRADGQWSLRTYERGVEGETLACGTGSVAAGVILGAWGLSGPETHLQTRSNSILTVTAHRAGGSIRPSLRGEGRIVFTGELQEL